MGPSVSAVQLVPHPHLHLKDDVLRSREPECHPALGADTLWPGSVWADLLEVPAGLEQVCLNVGHFPLLSFKVVDYFSYFA